MIAGGLLRLFGGNDELQHKTFATLLLQPAKIAQGCQGIEVTPDGLMNEWVGAGHKLKPRQNGALWQLAEGPWSLVIVPQPEQAPECGFEVRLELTLTGNDYLPRFLAQQSASLDLDDLRLMIREIAGRWIMMPGMSAEECEAARIKLSLDLMGRIGLRCSYFKPVYLFGDVPSLVDSLRSSWMAQVNDDKSAWQEPIQETLSDSELALQQNPDSGDLDDLSGLATELGLSPKRSPMLWWKPAALDDALRMQLARNLDAHALMLMNWRRKTTELLDDNAWHSANDLESQLRLTAQRVTLLPSLVGSDWNYHRRRQIAGLIREAKDMESGLQRLIVDLTAKGNDTSTQAILDKASLLLSNLLDLLQQRKENATHV